MSNRHEKPVHLSENNERKKKTTDITNSGTEVFYSEEKSILDRDVVRDGQAHHTILENLASIMQETKLIKASPSEQEAEDLQRLQMEAVVNFAALKKMNRIGHLRSKRVREQTQEAKQRIDGQHLQLQNLLYELQHLQREVHKCLQFKSKHESISLVSDQEYKNLQPVQEEEDDHKRMLSRMDWELKERIKLSHKLEECKRRREEVLARVGTKRSHLSGLQPKLQAILTASKPLQEDLNLRLTEEREQLSLLPHLPAPLHLLFVQASSLAKYVEGVGVEIVGDRVEGEEEEDKAFVLEESESEEEGEEKKHQRASSEDKAIKKRQELFKTHPLAVVVTAQLPVDLGRFQLSFHHFSHLHFVSVAFHFLPSSTSIPTSHPLFSRLSFLSNLFAGERDDDDDREDDDDNGEVSPNTFNTYILNKLGVEQLTTHLSDQVGRPYKWAQALCGLDALMLATAGVKRTSVEQVVRLVAQRLNKRLALYRTIASLSDDSTALLHAQNSAIRCILENFVCADKDGETGSGKSFVYTGRLKHASTHLGLSFSVCIPHSYPEQACFFTIRLGHPHQGGLTSSNSQVVRELECKVNTPACLPSSCFLSHQLTLLCAGFDLLLFEGASARGPIRSLVVK